MRTGIERIPAALYHSDPCAVPSLSSSIAHVLDSKSPQHAYTVHPRLGGRRLPPEKHLDDGSLIHALLLGEGKEIVAIEHDDYRTKAAKEARDAARARGAQPVKARELEHARDVADVLRARIAEFGFDLEGQKEAALFWTEDGVQCRGMADLLVLSDDRALILDLKTCRSAHPEACRRHIDGYGYAIQNAAYVSALEHIRPDLEGRVDFVFLFCELDPWCAVQPVRLDGAFRHLGLMRWRRALATWKRCLATNTWPGYARECLNLEPPPWAMARELERGTAFDQPPAPAQPAPEPELNEDFDDPNF